MAASITSFYEKPAVAENKPGALQLFFVLCLLFQGRNIVYRLIGVLAWANIGLLGYMTWAVFQKFAIHY